MKPNKRVDDFYTNKARKEWYMARSVYKLEEIDHKYPLFSPAPRTVIDVGCAPWSWLQYISRRLHTHYSWSSKNSWPSKNAWSFWSPWVEEEPIIVGFDIKPVALSLPYTTTFTQDITQRETVRQLFHEIGLEPGCVDLIVSDMAPDTIGMADIDAMRSIGLLEKMVWMLEEYLCPDGKFVLKIFMWPGFDEFIRMCKDRRWAWRIVVYKPKACRSASKETYIVKRS
jgi:23S rRNA (uridine2552-2'-O)-methyltransferase